MPLIELMENSGFIQSGKPNFKMIEDASITRIMEFCEQFSEITSYESLAPEKSAYSHSASISLGGGRTPCKNLDCRLDKVFEMTQFAAFYSDRVYINNFLYDHLLHDNYKSNDVSILKKVLCDDITILSYLYPLIKTGNILPVTFNDICPHCLAVKSSKGSTDDKFKEACGYLEQRYLNEVDYFLEKKGNRYGLIANGPDTLLPHGSQIIVFNKKEILKKQIPDVIKNLKTGMKIPLSKHQIGLIECSSNFVKRIVQSVAFELGGSHNLKTAYLSDSEIEIKFIQELIDDPLAKKRAVLMDNYLTCLVPFIENVDPINLLKLRNEEQEHFIVFRQALVKAIDEYKINGDSFTERDAQALYSDIIQPHLAKLDIKVKSAKRHFVKDSTRKIIGWVGAISAGFLAGLSTSNFLAGSVAFGSVKAGAELIDNIMSKSDAEETIKEDEMYFLWRVKKLAE